MEPETLNLPVLALRGLTVFPHTNLTFDVERRISMKALEVAMETGQEIFLVTQREINVDKPTEQDLYTMGTISRVTQILRLGQNSLRVMVEGGRRARLKRLWQLEPYLQGHVELVEESETVSHGPRTEALLRQTWTLFQDYAQLAGNVAEEVTAAALDCQDPGYLADLIAQNIALRYDDKQAILEEVSPLMRLRKLNGFLARERDVLGYQRQMEGKVRDELAQQQKEQILRTQIRVLQNELGEDEDNEIDEYRQKLDALKLDDETRQHLEKEITKLAKQPYVSAEASVIRNYLDVCLELPWGTYTKERLNVEAARKVLDRDHFGLEKVKERILEFIAVRQLNPQAKGKILCLVGPPGVGKTSIALSVAKAMHRKLSWLSLGGVRDEADIRGHRKTYIGAMPGRIIDAVIRSGSMNPLLVLDEIDKLGSDYRGDPASALLEVLDSEQNHAFRDHFLEVPVDLSRVMFITTANTLDTIPRPLLDRMEVIELTSYTDEEKLQIAKRHLLPKQLKEHGLKKTQLRITDDAIRRVIAAYTKESGVRVLERQLGKLCRKAAMQLVEGDVKRVDITENNLKELLGTQQYRESIHSDGDQVGVANGLAWTEVCGELLEVEAQALDGSGKLELTGNLGSVMQESAKAALTCLRSRWEELGLPRDFYKTKDVHVHFPEGAVPKDGPSAGIAITTAIVSALTGTPVRRGLAMTGEVTLRGRVLPIGGLKEKTMAAFRNGIRTVIIPADNGKDLEEIDQTVRGALQFHLVEQADQVLAIALPTLMAGEKENTPKAEPEAMLPPERGSAASRLRQ